MGGGRSTQEQVLRKGKKEHEKPVVAIGILDLELPSKLLLSFHVLEFTHPLFPGFSPTSQRASVKSLAHDM